MNILVLDVGTSGMRGILLTHAGRELSVRRRAYHPVYLEDGWVEQNPAVWEESMYAILSEVAEDARERNWGIDAIALTSQRSSVIPVDATLRPLANAIMWQDKRTEELCAQLSPHNDRVFARSGSRVNSVFSGAKMAWVRQKRPELYKKTAKFLVPPDLLIHRLTGRLCSDHTYGGRSNLMELRSRRWDAELLELFGVEADKLCELVPPGSVCGPLTKEAAERTGCPEGIPVVTAGGDQQCGAIGQGVVREGVLSITAGTGGFLIAAADKVPEQLRSDVICSPSAIAGRYVLESNLLTCCSAFDWFRREFYPEDSSFERISAELERSPAGAEGCICLPYFQGRATPDFNGAARGQFAGLTLGTRRCDLLRALVEGIACELGNGVDIMRGYVEVSDIRINGGLTNSDLFCGILAGVCGCSMARRGETDATARGALAVAAAALGCFADVGEAVRTIGAADPIHVYDPDAAEQEVYLEIRRKMNKIYRRMTVEE